MPSCSTVPLLGYELMFALRLPGVGAPAGRRPRGRGRVLDRTSLVALDERFGARQIQSVDDLLDNDLVELLVTAVADGDPHEIERQLFL